MSVRVIEGVVPERRDMNCRGKPGRGCLVFALTSIVVKIHAVSTHTDDCVENAKRFDHGVSFF